MSGLGPRAMAVSISRERHSIARIRRSGQGLTKTSWRMASASVGLAAGCLDGARRRHLGMASASSSSSIHISSAIFHSTNSQSRTGPGEYILENGFSIAWPCSRLLRQSSTKTSQGMASASSSSSSSSWAFSTCASWLALSWASLPPRLRLGGCTSTSSLRVARQWGAAGKPQSGRFHFDSRCEEWKVGLDEDIWEWLQRRGKGLAACSLEFAGACNLVLE